MVAECKKAETGVGAFIAPGNQKWKGNCADLVKAPIKRKPNINGYSSCCMIISRSLIKAEIEYVPAILPINTNPATRKNPPIPVIVSAVNALFLDSACSLLKPIRKNELILVSSQKIKSNSRLSDRTSPNIADMKSNK